MAAAERPDGMDPIIEQGYAKLLDTVRELQKEKEQKTAAIRENEGTLIARMAADTVPVIATVGLEILRRGKKEMSGELYNQEFYDKKMIVLGKTDPLPYRPDDPGKTIDTQICVLADDGNFYEVMYSTTEILVDSYLNPLKPDEALEIYGFEILFMLYRAIYEYAQKEEELMAALARTLEYIAP
jgi:hypothetical protein